MSVEIFKKKMNVECNVMVMENWMWNTIISREIDIPVYWCSDVK